VIRKWVVDEALLALQMLRSAELSTRLFTSALDSIMLRMSRDEIAEFKKEAKRRRLL